MKKFTNNRLRTKGAIDEIIVFLSDSQVGFSELPPEVKLDLSMKFFQCEKGRLQKGKIYVDFFAHLVPLTVSLAAMFFSLKK